jgi:UDP-glucose 6-dehydrogenase
MKLDNDSIELQKVNENIYQLLCEKKKLSYTTIKDLMLKNGWIHPYHTNIPGHDKQISFGGACFPKDVSALTQYMIVNEIPTAVLEAVRATELLEHTVVAAAAIATGSAVVALTATVVAGDSQPETNCALTLKVVAAEIAVAYV